MNEPKSFRFQLFVMGGFLFFFYMFFALATSIYRNYRLETEISEFQQEVEALSELVEQRPDYLEYVLSDQYKDLHAKESQNMKNPGERLIIVPSNDENVDRGPVALMTEELSANSILNQPNAVQWWEYFFGNTLSVKVPVEKAEPIVPEEKAEEDVEG